MRLVLDTLLSWVLELEAVVAAAEASTEPGVNIEKECDSETEPLRRNIASIYTISTQYLHNRYTIVTFVDSDILEKIW